jgi:uncharacterized Zn-binding protein involved in type VI secretion
MPGVGFPAAREGDTVTHDLVVPAGVIAPPLIPCPPTLGPVLIEGLPAAHVGCSVLCSGATSLAPIHPPPPPGVPPPPIVTGSATVLIHGLPAARWAPSGDLSACGAFLGDPKLAPSRRVLIGGPVISRRAAMAAAGAAPGTALTPSQLQRERPALKASAQGSAQAAEKAPKHEAVAPPVLKTTPLLRPYRGENTAQNRWHQKTTTVQYLDETERAQFRLSVKDGKLYDATGKPFDTSQGESLHTLGGGRAIWVMDEKGNIYASNHHEKGEFHHSSFLAGGDVAGAGEMEVKNGELVLLSSRSGHYRPKPEIHKQATSHMASLGIPMKRVTQEGI